MDREGWIDANREREGGRVVGLIDVLVERGWSCGVMIGRFVVMMEWFI